MDNRTQTVINQGSQLFPYSVPAIAAGATQWWDVESLFAEARIFTPLDSILVQNNDAQEITFYLDSLSDPYDVLPFTIQPISRRYFRRFGIKNTGLIPTLATTIKLSMRRLPPDVVATVGVR